METTNQDKVYAYARARKRVQDIKEFYHHLFFYLLFNIPLLVFAKQIADLLRATVFDDPEFGKWIELNMYITPLFWGIGLLFHGLYTFIFKGRILKNWEEKQIRKYLDQE